MRREEFLEFQREFMDKMVEITKAKNSDYAGGSSGAFSNFTAVEYMGACTTEQGFVTRMLDKMSRIASYVKQGKLEVKDESVTDTLSDLANYCILFAGYLHSKKSESATDLKSIARET